MDDVGRSHSIKDSSAALLERCVRRGLARSLRLPSRRIGDLVFVLASDVTRPEDLLDALERVVIPTWNSFFRYGDLSSGARSLKILRES